MAKVNGNTVCSFAFSGSRRASTDRDEFEVGGEKADEMSEEEKEYLRWFYRTEDPTMWKFVMLGLAFVCLLIGFMLLGMGAMANKNRKKIAKYKAAAALLQKSEVQELRVISHNSASVPTPESLSVQDAKPRPSNGDVSELKPGDIVVTWRDGNTSCLYSEPAAEAELPGEEEKEEEVEKQEEVSTTELETEGVKHEEE
ncbi:organic solute transporter subunit beta [Sphaeramia orbicularis]|uniref:organic solute transporter subunit beta n=1 Tax=Sphaeramia orbicularis TaxID=375764 RepID=UPI00117EBF3F|nr:organic solute transporter subunit beta-like [Sphaeramia orbicularis]